MVVLSSFYTYILRFFLTLVIFLNVVGILYIKYLIPKEKSITYDLSQNFTFIIVCLLIFFLSSRLAIVKLDKKENSLIVKRFLTSSFIIKNKEIIDIEKVSLLTCKVIYKKNDVKKSVKFLPNLTLFFPLSNYPIEIKKMLKINKATH